MAGTVRKRSWTTNKGETKTNWTAYYTDQNGTRHNKAFPTKKAADAYLLRARTEVRDGIHVYDRDSITVAEAGELWLARGAAAGLERSSLLTASIRIRHINRLLGNWRLADLTAPVIESWRDEMVEAVGRRYAAAILNSLKGVLAEAQRRGLAFHNPALATRVKIGARDKERLEIGRGIPSAAEVNAILNAASGRWRPVLTTAAYTGMRASELRGLTWDAVDLPNRVIHVWQRADAWGTLGAPKSAAGRRDIPLHTPVVSVLREWRVASPFGPAGLVFCATQLPNRGNALGHATLWWAFREIQKAAGVVTADGRPKYRFHTLRHFFASAGIAAGFPPKRLQELMGHSSISMTYDVYGHLFPAPEDDRTRLEAIERMITGKPAT
jgi:integrase